MVTYEVGVYTGNMFCCRDVRKYVSKVFKMYRLTYLEKLVVHLTEKLLISRIYFFYKLKDCIKKFSTQYIYTMEFYTAQRKKELIPFATAWMELESIMLSEIILVSFSFLKR